MRPGDPFETEALDELRAKQRRGLRLVPDWFLELYGPSPSQTIDAIDIAPPGLVEQELRGLAEEARAELGDLAAQMEKHTAAEVRRAAVQSWGADVTVSGASIVPGLVFSQKITELHHETSQARIGEQPDVKVAAALTRYVHLLVWADELASDGYRDPRLENRLST